MDTLFKPTPRRSRNRPVLADNGLTAGETRHLRRACVAVMRSLSDKQLKLRAEGLLTYVKQRQTILDLPATVITAAEPDPASLRQLSERIDARPPRPTQLDKRLAWLAGMIGLNHSELTILAVMARRTLFDSWRELIDMLPIKCQNPNVAVLAAMTGLPLVEVDRCLSPGATLLRAHMLRDDRDGEFDVSDLLKRIVRSHAVDGDAMMQWLAPSAPASSLDWEDFAHLGPRRDLALRILAQDRPVSILLHGEPGTGKTEFARLLAVQMGRRAVFAGLVDDNGHEPNRSERLAHLGLLKALCAQGGNRVLVMDEADDVLSFARRREASKQWVNLAVEEPGVSTIWILNNPRELDPSVLRRMTLAIGFEQPPLTVRQRIVETTAERLGMSLADAEVRSLAALPTTPAQLAMGLGVALQTGGGAQDAREAVTSVLDAMGRSAKPERAPGAVYDPRWSSAQMDLTDLATRLQTNPDKGWSILLSGPSGTGKSAYARHLARQLGVEVEERRGADLLGPYIGETEAKIADAFAKAEARRALLLIDEADGFLFRREAGQRSWETNLVNEMLRQMEDRSFPFIATTNLADHLDPAAQRRFTFRVGFSPMTPAQARGLFQARFGHALPANAALCDSLTPGDFAVVAQRASLLSEKHLPQLVRWLNEEAEARGQSPRPVGFHIPQTEPLLIASQSTTLPH